MRLKLELGRRMWARKLPAWVVAGALSGLGALSGMDAVAAVPGTLSVQGGLLSAGGGPVSDGNYNMTFSIYKDALGGSPVVTEGPVVVSVKNGAYAWQLGSKNAVKIGRAHV